MIFKFFLKITFFIIITILISSSGMCLLLVLFPFRKRIGPAIIQFYSKLSLLIFRINVELANPLSVPDFKNKGILLIANHVSMLDIFLLSALYRTVYVSKEEVMYYPIIGQAAWLAGIVFLKRSSKEDRSRLIRSIADQAKGKIITIFAQGTTSRIEDHLPFKCGIFKSIELNHEIVILPVTIHYKEDSQIAWTDGQNLLDNLVKICSLNRIHVKVFIDNPVSIDDYQDRTISDVCRMTQDKVLSGLKGDY